MKAPERPNNERARLLALREYDILDTPAEPAFDDIVDVAALITGAPIALISLIDEERQWLKSAHGLERGELPRDTALCAHVLSSAEMIVVDNVLDDPRFADNPMVTGPAHVRFYTGVPLVVDDNLILGTLCVMDRVPRQMQQTQLDALKALAKQVIWHLRRIVAERSVEEAHQRFFEVEAELRRAKEEAERMDKVKSAFLANMSHELRTPLNAVIGFGKLLGKNKKQHLDDKELTWAKRIQANGEHLLSLINDLLDISKIEAGHMKLVPTELDLAELVRELVEQIAPVAAETRTKIRLAAPNFSAPIRADEQRLRQVILNLLSNALKFGLRKPMLIRMVSDGERPLRLDVVDSGIGIARDKVDRVFEPFRQADETTARSHEGTGLGLAIARLLCRQMGFDLVLNSIVGVGSTFSIMLAPDAVPPVHTEPSERPEAKQERVTLNPTSSFFSEDPE